VLVDRLIRAGGVGALAISLTAVSLPLTTPIASASDLVGAATDLPNFLFKKKKSKPKKKKKKRSKGKEIKPRISSAEAQTKRDAIREAVAEAREAEDWNTVADGLESNGAILGDPVTLMEAGEARLKQAEKERSIEDAEKAIETTRKSLDILHFLAAVAADEAETSWYVIPPPAAAEMITQGDAQVAAAETLIEEIEQEQKADEEAIATGPGRAKKAPKKKKDRGPRRPGTGLIVGGSVATAVGLAGAGLGIAGVAISGQRQNAIEDEAGQMVPDQDKMDELDAEGKRANVMGYAGLGVAVVGLAVGVPLIVIGLKKRREAGPSASARVLVAPYMSTEHNGLVLSGRF
jgi:hypothetical protein